MDPTTAVTVATATSSVPLGLWEYLLGQGVFGALTGLFLYLWLKANKDIQALAASKAKELRELGATKDKALLDLQGQRLDDVNTAADKRLEMQGKLIESMNRSSQSFQGLQEQIKTLRELLAR